MQQYTPNDLTQYRMIADAPADTVIERVLAEDATVKLNELLRSLSNNDSFETAALPAPMREFVAKASVMPDWYDAQKAALGEKLFTKYGMEICVILLCKSLPECYLCWRGAVVLYETGRLTEQRGNLSRLTKRIAETLQFVINVMAEGGTTPEGAGVVTAQKIRLIHASIRAYIKQYPWEETELGEPINQEDLALTWTTFSSSVLEGLEMLAIKLSDEEKAAYMHCWRIIGHFMGVESQFLSDSYSDAVALQTAILSLQAGSTMENKALAASILDFIEAIIPIKDWKGIAPYAMEFFLGKKYAKMLGIKASWLSWNHLRFALTLWLIKCVSKEEQQSYLLQAIISSFGKVVMQGLVLYFNDYKKVQFDVPPSLRGAWGLDAKK
ncbi:MAG: oxygenase MpaB family protein [Candidatus Kapaibacteriota bacterium]